MNIEYQKSNLSKKFVSTQSCLCISFIVIFICGFISAIFFSAVVRSISSTFSTSKSDSAKKEIKIFCYVLNHKNVEFVAKTWGKRCNRLVLLHTKHLKNKWREEQEALRHIYFSYKNNYDWFVRADATSFYFVNNLRKILNCYSKNTAWAYDLNTERSIHANIVNYALNQLGLQRLVEHGVTKLCNNIRTENVGLALRKCLKASNVRLIERDRGIIMSKSEFTTLNTTNLAGKEEPNKTHTLVLVNEMTPKDIIYTEFLMRQFENS